ncbi:hypothetical protein PTSG_09749 [Salpingoeca rosetta]|uniref:Phosphatidic acid phosphatase type 2/haloperoxidase domain-containing protein n=1 Tax=Salpingoeca rosetta (strain ATCC 50818 / BSB-021) TaxID=946362 RepID=F2UNY0_SALR5|nr:uncharacterized protein PTSG_09749 [Salpingoeca rosetta]EGD79335.1 hypothetical protein PTSG_09749 [Salpingoeca rosetta]|eukprot:XP_004989104.1 hypothetical protein PTSG_09749 [Salpingoeca rosetta]
MARQSVTSQLSQLEEETQAVGSKPQMTAQLVQGSVQRCAPSLPASGLKYWRDISWPSFFTALALLVISRIKAHANTDWTVNEFNHVLYRYPMVEKEIVPTWAFLLWIFAMAFVVLGLEIWLVRSVTLKTRVIMGFNVGLGMLEGFFYTVAFTEFTKIWIGEPRPDFVARCLGSHDAVASFDADGVIVCTQQVGSNARESFPSGHSSTTFSCGVFLTAYFIWTAYFRRVNLPWRDAARRWYSRFGLMVADIGYLACFWPIVFAAFVAASRVSDHRHSPADVVSGALLGTLFGAILFARLLSRDYAAAATAQPSVHPAAHTAATPLLSSSSSAPNANASADVFAQSAGPLEDQDDTDNDDN